MLTFSLQSGSNGNAIYVEADGVRLLFDAGISGRQAKVRMAAHDRDIRRVDALILSHSHSDHTRCAGVYQRLFKTPIYASAGTAHTIAPYLGAKVRIEPFIAGAELRFGEVVVHTLSTPHDAHDSVSFIVEHGGRRLGILTDLGHTFGLLRSAVRTLDAVYLESNYDPEMLATGWYPPALKERIRGAGGHLSNAEAAALLAGCDRGRLQWAALAHLSEENNCPELAVRTHRAALGPELPLHVASRYGVSDVLRVS